MSAKWLQIGIEEEYQIVDSERQLRSHIDTLLKAAEQNLHEEVKAEMMQSVVEVGTRPCDTAEQCRTELVRLRTELNKLLAPHELRIACAGAHPFAEWKQQQITNKERYRILEEEMQDVVRQLLIFGLHVHVSIPDLARRIEVMNEARYFLPHLLALSTSSPFWLSRDTGLKSYRSVIWSRFPRTGIPPEFESHHDYESYVDLLIRTRCIDDGKKIWWDLRAHPNYPTVEFRICDQPTRVEETICLAALMQGICAKLLALRNKNLGFRKYQRSLIAENKWRAQRHGIQGKLIDFGKQKEVPFSDLAEELLEFVDDVVDDLGSRAAVEYVHTILRDGTSADRQLAVYRKTRDWKAVVDSYAAESVPAKVAVA